MADQLPIEVRMLTEDDVYRTSSQFRLWNFSAERLAYLRRTTHELAIERIEQQRKSTTERIDGSTASDESANAYLSEDEELKLVVRYCEQVRTTSDHLGWPVNVKATAIQYLRRFYTSNSVLTYPPKEIYKTALFLASKTEAIHERLPEYGRRISTPPEQILAPEYKLMQALRFTLDVRQPFRGLKGVLMELENMVEGLPDASLRDGLRTLGSPEENNTTLWRIPAGTKGGLVETQHLHDRVNAAYAAAKELLDQPALLTDAYFFYTPSQILHAALHLADTPLESFLLDSTLPPSSPVRIRILATIHACADMLSSFSRSAILSKEERASLEQRLEKCRDPSTRDLVKGHLARKAGTEDSEDKARKRKEQREKSAKEGDDLFGPAMPSAVNGMQRR